MIFPRARMYTNFLHLFSTLEQNALHLELSTNSVVFNIFCICTISFKNRLKYKCLKIFFITHIIFPFITKTESKHRLQFCIRDQFYNDSSFLRGDVIRDMKITYFRCIHIKYFLSTFRYIF